MNLTAITEIQNGKKLTAPQKNLLAKLAKLGVRAATEPGVRTNPYSGTTHTLEPLAVTLYDFIWFQYKTGMVGKLFPVSVWDRARYMFANLWPTIYMDLLD